VRDSAYGRPRVVDAERPRSGGPARSDLRGKAWDYTRKLVLRRDGERCTYCGCSRTSRCQRHRRPGVVPPVRLCVDHKLPPERGGATLDPANLATACQACNAEKADRTPEEWQARRERRQAYQRGERPAISGNYTARASGLPEPPISGDYSRKPDR
jgi:hypothetical protein